MTISHRLFTSIKLALLLLAAATAFGLVAPAAHAQTPTHQLLLSLSPDRSGADPLQGASVHDNVYVFTQSSVALSRVRFFLDDPQMTGTPRQSEATAPYDFAGTATDGKAKPWDTRKHSDGTHTITAAFDQKTGGTVVVSATFTIRQLPSLSFGSSGMTITAIEAGSPKSQTTTLSASDRSAAAFNVTDDAGWLTVSQSSPTTPAQLTVMADPAGLAVGTYSATVTASALGYASAKLPVTFKVTSDSWCSDISPLACSDVMQRAPYRLDFGSDAGMIADGAGLGTGFTMIDPTTHGDGLLPEKVQVDTAAGVLKIATTAGLASGSSNSQDNALGVGIDAPDQVSVLSTTLKNIPSGTGKFEQAGLWFGNDEDNYAKIVVRSGTSGTTVQLLLEVAGAQKTSLTSPVLDLTGRRLTLALRADPATKGVTGTYSVDGATPVRLGILRAPAEFFSFDQARIDPTIGTDSFGGILASHRNATSPVTYTFDDFSLTAETSGGSTGGGGGAGSSSAFAFDRASFAVTRPTAMALGPDGRLYVTEFLGKVHALTLGPD